MPTIYSPITGHPSHVLWGALVNHYQDYLPKLTHPSNAALHQLLLQKYPSVMTQAITGEPTVTAAPKSVKTIKKAPETEPLVPIKGFTFGADPELFVKNQDGLLVCADMIPGTKDEPHKVKHGAVQRDGMAAEYNIDPCSTFEEWNRNHKAVQGQLQDMLPKGFTLVAAPAVRFSSEVFDAAPDMAKELGCSPDWNAWDATLNPPACPPPEDPYLRCAGGHAHLGWTEDADVHDVQHMMNGFDLTKQLDWFLGAWSLRHDNDTDRRRLYGRAGACRIKPYGVEYRVLSNFWVLDKALRLEVWNRMVQAVACMSKYFVPEQISGGYQEVLQHSINTGVLDRALSQSIKFPLMHLTPPVAI